MTAMTALIGFAAWTLALVMIVLLWRVIEILRGKPANSWGRGNAIACAGLVTRAEHAHLNALENLPLFAVRVLAATARGQTAAVETVACWVLYARIAPRTGRLRRVRPIMLTVRRAGTEERRVGNECVGMC